jgi:hypothetical protein
MLKEPAIFFNTAERFCVCKIPTSIKIRINKASRALREQLKPVGGVF